MKFELDQDKGETFQYFKSEILEDGETKFYDPEPDEPCRVTLKLADPDFIEGVHAETRKTIIDRALNPKTHSMERIKDFEQTLEQKRKERELIWGNAILGWEGVLDVNGKVVECNQENKMRMMNIPVFARFIGRCLQLISGEASEKAGIQRKNL